MKPGKVFWAIVIFLCFLTGNARATHLRAAEIRVRTIDCTSLTVEITVIIFINYYRTNATPGGQGSILQFGDGSSQQIPEFTTYEIVDDALKVGRVEYKTFHTYKTPGQYLVSFRESNRNDGIVNFDQSVSTPFYTETLFTLESGICNTSPYLIIQPIDRACRGIAFYHNPGAIDPDNDSLSFELVIPQRQVGTPVVNYVLPNNSKFYTSVPYTQGNEERNGSPVIFIASDGTITWNAPDAQGEYGIAIKVKEWKYNATDSLWHQTGFVIRDMQIIVEECTNKKPDLLLQKEYCVTAGEKIEFDGIASDPEGHPVFIEAFSEVFLLPEKPARIVPPNRTLQSTQAPHDTASVKFIWETSCSHIKSLPYQVVFKITDQPPSGPKLIKFVTVNIKVVAPRPVYESVSVNPVTKTVTLRWKPYSCKNIQQIQVWRRIAKYNYEQSECNTGMPRFLRYQLVTVLSGDAIQYSDSDLETGAQYCYRIVALVGNQKNPSRISLDTCLIPKPAEAPVLTNVSVTKTHLTNGEIKLRWTSPFNIDRQQYPPPYQYKVYRGSKINDELVFQPVTLDAISDTTFTDININTRQSDYQYKIQLYVPALTSAPVDTSSTAGSVFLEALPMKESIELSWQANTPWYNYSEIYPYHLIYRSDTGPSGEFVLIDSVNVNENDFYYIDNGQYKNKPLAREVIYYYKVLTRGTYGNPAIKSPIENFSQITGLEVLDTIPPCKPILSIATTNCSTFSCDENSYFNDLIWEGPVFGCTQDVVAYEVLVQHHDNEGFTSLGITSNSSFLHGNLNSMAKCYKLIAVDDSGNKSDSSEVVCNDNCPHFELPNVFTPGKKDDLNDFFKTFPNADNTTHCSRFVKKVDLKIYDRWGREIYSISAGPETDFNLWDGSGKSGKEASTGIYFYQANILFDMRDPSQSRQQIKGWVHVIH